MPAYKPNTFIMDNLKEHRKHKEKLLGISSDKGYVNIALDRMLSCNTATEQAKRKVTTK